MKNLKTIGLAISLAAPLLMAAPSAVGAEEKNPCAKEMKGESKEAGKNPCAKNPCDMKKAHKKAKHKGMKNPCSKGGGEMKNPCGPK